jgi:transcriptional regulatory protein LevR
VPFSTGSRPVAEALAVVLLDVKPYTLAQVVAVLVKRHGRETAASGGPMLPT